MKDTKEDINKKRTTFSNSIMGIGGIPGNNIKFYIPKILYGIRSPQNSYELLPELDNIYFRACSLQDDLNAYLEEEVIRYNWMNEYMSFIEENFDTTTDIWRDDIPP